ncbi:hypothetical protein [Persephonella sp.]
MFIADAGKLLDTQDKILTELGNLDEELIISGSFGFVRAYSQHRITDTIQIYTENPEIVSEKLKDIIDIREVFISERWQIPEKVPQVSVSTVKDGINLKIHLIKDIFQGMFEKTKLEIGLYLEDLEGIYHRILLDLVNSPENILYAVDIAYIDDEYHLVDFIEIFSKNTGIKSDSVVESFKKLLEVMDKDRFSIDRTLREHGVNISSNVMKRWTKAKIEELSQ